jgi:hypothetical protein
LLLFKKKGSKKEYICFTHNIHRKQNLIDTMGAIGVAVYLPPAMPNSTPSNSANMPPTSPITSSSRSQATGNSTTSTANPTSKMSSSNMVGPGKMRRKSSVSSKLVEAVVLKKAKVRDCIDTVADEGDDHYLGSLNVGVVVVVLETALSDQGTLRNKVKVVYNEQKEAVSNGLEGWVTSSLISPKRLDDTAVNQDQEEKEASGGGVNVNNPKRLIKRQVSLQRPKHHAAL